MLKLMFEDQLARILSNVLAFIILGLLSGLLIVTQSYLETLEWLNTYLSFANINIDYGSFGESLFTEHLAPNSLTIILIFVFFLSSCHRISRGAIEKMPEEKEGVIYSLYNFGSLLAIAWLGLMIGVSLPALIFEGWPIAAKFWIMSLYPVAFLFEITFCITLLYWIGTEAIPDYTEDRAKWKWRTRAEGLFILLLAILMLTFFQQYQELMNSLVGFIITAL